MNTVNSDILLFSHTVLCLLYGKYAYPDLLCMFPEKLTHDVFYKDKWLLSSLPTVHSPKTRSLLPFGACDDVSVNLCDHLCHFDR